MAARLTETQKKKIVADYVCMENYAAVAKINRVSPNTVKSVVKNADNAQFAEKCTRKKEEVSRSIMEYLDGHKNLVCDIIGKSLAELVKPEKLEAATMSQITTALGTLIDKWAMLKGTSAGTTREDDPLTKALREEAEKMNTADW